MPKFKLSVLSVVVTSLALAACGGGGGGNGGGGVNTGSTPTGGGSSSGSTNQPGKKPVPMPSENPSLSDSHEKADPVIESSNKFENNDFGMPNKQANHLNLKDAYDQGLSGSGIKVGLIDGTVSLVNPALPEVVNHGTFGQTNNTSTDHATAVALAIAGKDINGNVLGIAKNVQLHIADASAGDDKISRNAALAAMHTLFNNGVRIMNNSYGNNTYAKDANDYINAEDKSKTYIGQLKELTDKGTLMIWAAGNSGSNQPTSESLLPLAEPELQKGFITVVGVNEDNTINNQSNKCGDAKNWCMAALWKYNTANVHATTNEQMNDYALSSTAGTSLAAPQVTAAAALVLQKYPWMTNDNLRTTLLTTATDLGAKGVDSVYGWGLLNIGKAVNGVAQFAFGDFNANVSDGLYEFSNDISGDGGLIKNGKGQLTLSGNNTFSGTTSVNSGTLVVTGTSVSKTNINKDGKFAVINGKSGSINNNNGTFFSSDAVINGNYTQSASGKFETLIGSVTSITGDASLNGNLSFTGIKTGYIPLSGSTLDVLKASSVTGQFTSTDIDSKLLLDGKTLYTNNSVKLAISRVAATKAIENLSPSQSDNVAIHSGAKAIDNAFNKLDTHFLSDDVNADTLSFAAGASKLQNISENKNLANSLYSLSGAIYSNGAAISSLIQGRLNQDFMNYLDMANNDIQAIIQYDHMDNHWNPSGLSSKQSTNSGLIGGMKKLNNSLTIGSVYAFQNTDLSQGLADNKTDNADIKSNGIMLGAKYQSNLKNIYIKGSIGYSDYSNNVNRLIFLDDEIYKTGTKVNGDLWQAGLLAGKQFNLNNFVLIPQIGFRYDYLHQKAFNENGALGYGLNAHSLNKGVFSGGFNLSGLYNFNIKNIPFSAFGLIGIEHDFNSRQFATNGGFNGMHINDTKSGYWKFPKNRWNLGTGINVNLSKKINAGLSYRYEKGNLNWKNNRIDANLRIGI